MDKHLCHAEGCPVEVAPKMLMCFKHWKMVRPAIQAKIWKEYRPGQEIDKRPTAQYLEVMEEAIQCVKAKEQGQE
jgi:hypothetical protein